MKEKRQQEIDKISNLLNKQTTKYKNNSTVELPEIEVIPLSTSYDLPKSAKIKPDLFTGLNGKPNTMFYQVISSVLKNIGVPRSVADGSKYQEIKGRKESPFENSWKTV